MRRGVRRPELERLVSREAGLAVGVELRDGTLVLSGRVQSPEERQAAEDVVSASAPTVPIDNDIEIEPLGLGLGEAPLERAVDHVEVDHVEEESER